MSNNINLELTVKSSKKLEINQSKENDFTRNLTYLSRLRYFQKATYALKWGKKFAELRTEAESKFDESFKMKKFYIFLKRFTYVYIFLDSAKKAYKNPDHSVRIFFDSIIWHYFASYVFASFAIGFYLNFTHKNLLKLTKNITYHSKVKIISYISSVSCLILLFFTINKIDNLTDFLMDKSIRKFYI